MPCGPGLMGHQRHAQHAFGFGLHIGHGFHHLHAAALAAPARMDLGFHHPDGAGLAFGGLHRFIDGESRDALAGRHAEGAQNFLGLVFVNVHG